MRCNKCGAHGHFCFAETDVATDKAVHGLLRQHVTAHGKNGIFLIDGFFEWEIAGKALIGTGRVFKGEAFTGGTARIYIEQFCGGITDLFGGFALRYVVVVAGQVTSPVTL